MGKELFAARNIDEDTRILATEYRHEEGYDLLVEEWFFDGIRGRSLIFLAVQVKGLRDAEIEMLAKKILHLSEDVQSTYKREKDFVYFNFDFRI